MKRGDTTSASPMASVVIPVGGAAEQLSDQLRALSQQRSDFPFEVIIAVNDEESGARIESQMFSVPSCHITRFVAIRATEVRGPAHARNTGALAARAPRILFCDADDVVSSTWVAALIEALETGDLSTGPLDLDSLNSPRFAASRGRSWAEEPARFRGTFPIASTCNLGVKRSVLLELGGFDESLQTGEDVDFCFRAWTSGAQLRFHPAAVVRYRLRNSLVPLMKQGFRYGRAQVVLARRIRSAGIELERDSEQLRRWLWLVRHLFLAGRTHSRPRWLWTLSTSAGDLIGRLTSTGRHRSVSTLATRTSSCE